VAKEPNLVVGSLDALCAMLSTQLATWQHVETTATQFFGRRGKKDPDQHDMDRSRAVEIHMERLMSDMSQQTARLTKVFGQFLDMRTRRSRTQLLDREGWLRRECERLVEEKVRLNKEVANTQSELERLKMENKDLNSIMHDIRAESNKRVEAEGLEMARRVSQIHEESERRLKEERAAANRRLEEGRAQIEEQLNKEREITDNILMVVRELPPLQAAMELGDVGLLDEELQKWSTEMLPERFGEGKYVVEAVVKLARERLILWRGVEQTWKNVKKEVQHMPRTKPELTRNSQRVFRILKESQLTKIDLSRSDPEAMECISRILLAWQEHAVLHPNDVHALIVRKVVKWPHLGPFDFADLDICLRLVDRQGCGSEAFLSRARDLVENEDISPLEMKPLLAHIETMLFFLKYTTSEDLGLAYAEFRKQSGELSSTILSYLNWAEQEYPPGCELVKLSEGKDLLDIKNANAVLSELRYAGGSIAHMFQRKDGMRPFREIFYQWAQAMYNAFNLLVLPHHTQAICLLIFRRFLETDNSPHALIAQVGTGEGKSMIIAALAVYVVTTLRKKVHVVVDDETLLERDFENFRRLFDACKVPATSALGRARPLTALICLSEERIATRNGDPCAATRIDPEVDICYCEAKHVQSFYASIARGEKRDFDSYMDRVLILDEVDALVIDEEPNDVFVYPNTSLSEMATSVAYALAQGRPLEDITHSSVHPATSRLVTEMSNEWARAKQMVVGADFVFSKETGRYCALHAGRANPKSWSLALECRNFQDGLSREIFYQERLFVASRPRVFRQYYRILGLSGSVGSKPEQEFLELIYGAAFFKVPPFLLTCRGSPFHEAVPVKLGSKEQAVYIEPNSEAQMTRLAEVVFEAREQVPVLVIARDRTYADKLVECLRQEACSRGLGGHAEDMIRSLSRAFYDANPEQWKENLNRSTLPLGEETGSGKSWRITVTDPRGARGTDYRMDDAGVDAHGGLLLIPTVLPTSRREWTQFLGRTARQDCRGQFCCVLCADDYQPLMQKYQRALPTNGSLEAIENVLSWGDREAAERIQNSAGLYNCGLRMNELCEEVFKTRPDVLEDASAREHLVDVCQRFRWMSVNDVDVAFQRIPHFVPSLVNTEAYDLEAHASMPLATDARMTVPFGSGAAQRLPKSVVFCLDCSASMKSQDTGTPQSRFEVCLARVQQIMRDRILDCDLVSVVIFGPDVRVVFPPTVKGQGGSKLMEMIAKLQPQTVGGTRFFDGVAQSLQLLNQSGLAQSKQWLVCLTDGDDAGSRQQNAKGEIVNQILGSSAVSNLNMVVITVGSFRALNLQIISSWTEIVSAAGGVGRHLAEKDAGNIGDAFDVVAECLAVEVGGAIEC